MKKELKEMEDRITDKFNQAIVAASDSVPSSISDIVVQLTHSLNEVKIAQDKHIETHAINDKKIADSLAEILEQARKTNGRVSKLEMWKTKLDGFAHGVKVGGRGTWIVLATTVGVVWVVFGDIIKRKFGL